MSHLFHASRSDQLSYQVNWLGELLNKGISQLSPVLPMYIPDTLTAATPYHDSGSLQEIERDKQGDALMKKLNNV